MSLKQLRFHSFADVNGILAGRDWELRLMTKGTGFSFSRKGDKKWFTDKSLHVSFCSL